MLDAHKYNEIFYCMHKLAWYSLVEWFIKIYFVDMKK